jgi:hypothetical protein
MAAAAGKARKAASRALALLLVQLLMPAARWPQQIKRLQESQVCLVARR